MISSIRPSLTALKAAATGVVTVASNVANVRNSGRVEHAQVHAVDPSRRSGGRPPNGAEDLYRPLRRDNVATAYGGVRAVMREHEPPHTIEYDPGDPNANAEGLVARPNVDLEDQAVRLQQARHMYSANLKVIKTADDMMGYLIDRRA